MDDTKYNIPVKEKIYLIIERTLDKIALTIPAFQRYINRKAISKYGITFKTLNNTSEIDDVFHDYRFNDIRETDIVMDIGANVGAFSIFVSKMVKHVYAVEPMTHEILIENIKLNKIENISVLKEALGKGYLTLKWQGYKQREVMCKSLKTLFQLTGNNVTFLKLDCEGGEWSINKDELNNVRRIEAEVHNLDGTHKLSDFLCMLDESNFRYTTETPRSGIMMLHAFKKD